MKTTDLQLADLTPAPWRATYILRPDISVLAQSLHQYGWIAPLVVRSGTFELIDGYHRWLIVKTDKSLTKKLGRAIPCITVKCDTPQAMMMHLQLNRGRGLVRAESTSNIVRELLKTRRFSKSAIQQALSMNSDEMALMQDSTLIKHLNIPTHSYSKAWVPVEAPASVVDMDLVIERPPNEDR